MRRRWHDRTLPAGEPLPVDWDAHHGLCRGMARVSMTLLKNENHALPLGGNTKKLLVIGVAAACAAIIGDGSSRVQNPYRLDCPLDKLRSRLPDTSINYLCGRDINPQYSDIGSTATLRHSNPSRNTGFVWPIVPTPM